MTYNAEAHGTQQDVVNISSREESLVGQILSNLAPTPFELDGRRYASVESFWQGLYFAEESERETIAQMDGRTAKRRGMQKPEGIEDIAYEGNNSIKVGSSEHRELMRRALRAKFTQNELAREMLLGTGSAKLTHILIGKNGEPESDSRSIPADVFTGMLMELREEFRSTPAPIA